MIDERILIETLLDRKDGQILRLVEAGNVLFNRYDPGPIPAEQPTEADMEMAEWDIAVHETNCSALREVEQLKNYLAERSGRFACTEHSLCYRIAVLQEGIQTLVKFLNGVKMVHELEADLSAVTDAIAMYPTPASKSRRVRHKLVEDALTVAEDLSKQEGFPLIPESRSLT
jgi:hypothetical protein